MSRSWRPVPLALSGIPNLLVSTDFTPQSYSIHITDLANVWTESLDKKPIIMRGLKEDTSIDPTDGPDQIRKLLELLNAAFDPTSPDHGDTSMVLSAGGSREDENVLVIHVTVILPGGLRPLKWPMYLAQCPPSMIATELVLPIIESNRTRERDIGEMAVMLKDKDSVIAKLVDKLESVGTGLEHVFTSLSGRRKVTRSVAEDRVKGLAPFNQTEFRKRSSATQNEAGSTDVSELLESVFGGSGLLYGPHLDVDDSAALNDWWTTLGKGKHVALVDRGKGTAKRAETPPAPIGNKANDMDDSEDEDDFQVQATPPRKRDTSGPPKTSAPARTVVSNNDDETSDGEDEEILSSIPAPSRRVENNAVAKSSGSRLGAIGKRSKPLSPRPTAPVLQKQDDDGSETASDTEDDKASSPANPPTSPNPQPRRAMLGRIGGKTKASEGTVPSGAQEDDAGTTAKAASPKRSRLGAIGRKSGVNEEPVPKRGRGETPVSGREEQIDEEERPRETSQERADRVREELQKELQKRAGAGPAKKKRKF